jgi:hypothetical protein
MCMRSGVRLQAKAPGASGARSALCDRAFGRGSSKLDRTAKGREGGGGNEIALDNSRIDARLL